MTNTTTTTTTTGNGAPPHQLHSPKPITRSESVNPYPTTFVQADTNSFKQVVQMLTGSPETAKHASTNSDSLSKTHIPPIKSLPKRHQSGFKLYERRNSLNKLNINPLIPVSGFSPRKPEILSPSILDFPALSLSPVTPLIPDPFDRSGLPNCSYLKSGNANFQVEAEDKAIKEKGFYLHPSPTTTPRDSGPRLLTLFPLTSPRASGCSEMGFDVLCKGMESAAIDINGTESFGLRIDSFPLTISLGKTYLFGFILFLLL